MSGTGMNPEESGVKGGEQAELAAANLSAEAFGAEQRRETASQQAALHDPFASLTSPEPDGITALGRRIAEAKKEHNDIINLGIGVYQNEYGQTPDMACVVNGRKQVDHDRLIGKISGAYLKPLGHDAFREETAKFVLGDSLYYQLRDEGRIATMQTLGGTGSVRAGCELMNLCGIKSAHISSPTWGNHKPIAVSSGLRVSNYRYLSDDKVSLDFEGLLSDIKALESDSAAIFHPSCHNPTATDPSAPQWLEILEGIKGTGATALFDSAYLGFGEGIDEDAFAIRRSVSMGIPTIVAVSFSKIASMYNRRLGALLVITPSADGASVVEDNLESLVARPMHSNPPAPPAQVMAHVMSTPELREDWFRSKREIRDSVNSSREMLCDALEARGMDASMLRDKKGVFLIVPVSKQEVRSMAEKERVFLLDSGRVNLAAINSENVERIADSIVRAKQEFGSLSLS